MNNSEFYTSREDNYIGENKAFPAEIYRKVIEEKKKEADIFANQQKVLSRDLEEQNT